MLNIQTEIGVKGRFQITVKNADGSIKQELPWQDNLITDNGINVFNLQPITSNKGKVINNAGDINSYVLNMFANCIVGSGSVNPTTSNTSLTNAVRRNNRSVANSVVVEQPTDTKHPGFAKVFQTVKYIFTGFKQNENISEVGLATANYEDLLDVNKNEYYLYTHALIKDSNGVPTTITVLTNEILEVNYELASYWDIRSKTGEFPVEITRNGNTTTTVFEYSANIIGLTNHNSSSLPVGIGVQFCGGLGSNVNLYAWGADNTKDPIGAPYDFTKWNVYRKNGEYYETKVVNGLSTYAYKGESGSDYTGEYLHTSSLSNWGYTSNYRYRNLFSLVGGEVTVEMWYSPYNLNFPDGIRVMYIPLVFGNYQSSIQLSVILAEKGTGKGLPKTVDDVLIIKGKTKTVRYTGQP